MGIRNVSKSGLLINGAPVPKQRPFPVVPGSLISVCGGDITKPTLIFCLQVSRKLEERSCQAHMASPPMSKDCAIRASQVLANEASLLPRLPAPPAPQPEPSSVSEPPPWRIKEPLPPYVLKCVFAHDLDVMVCPLSMRSVGLTPDAPLVVGRGHQIGFFEGLLSSRQPFLTYISRSHFKIEPKEKKAGIFLVTCLGSNPFTIGKEKLVKGGKAYVRVPVNFEFSVFEKPGADTVFLQLSLEPSSAFRAVPESLFWLQLGGSVVQKDLPGSMKWLAGTASGLTVGRAYQRQLFVKALPQDVADLIGPDHFRIERRSKLDTCLPKNVMGTEFCLVAMGHYPVWLRRGKECVEAEINEPIPIFNSNRILLFTGASDLTLYGPGNKGTLHWTFNTGAPGNDSLATPCIDDSLFENCCADDGDSPR